MVLVSQRKKLKQSKSSERDPDWDVHLIYGNDDFTAKEKGYSLSIRILLANSIKIFIPNSHHMEKLITGGLQIQMWKVKQ